MKTRPSQFGFVALAAGLLLTSCGGGGGSPTPPGPRALSITTASLSEATAGQPYTQNLVATGGTPPYSWSLGAGSSLPEGLALSRQGVISGWPTATGSFSFSVQVKDSAAHTATRDQSLKVNPGPLTITTNSLPGGVAGQSYSQVLTATGGTLPYTWSLTEGSGPLPPGLALSSGGTISGIINTTTGSSWPFFDFTAQVTDASSQQSTRSLQLYVIPALVINQTSFPDGNIGTWYDGCISASGGTSSPYYFGWTLAAGSQPLPAGLSIEGAGVWGCIRGLPTQSGTFNLEIQVTDPGPPQQIATSTVRLFIDNRLALYAVDLPVGVVNQPYTGTLQALGGVPPYSWRITSGTLPEGIAFRTSGELDGTPVNPGVSALWVEVVDSAVPPATASGWRLLQINPPISFTTIRLSDGIEEREYSSFISLSGGRVPLSVRLTSGALPPGVSLGPSDNLGYNYPLTGMPTMSGTFAFTLEGADSFSPPVTTTADFTIRIAEPLTPTTTALPQGWTGDLYDFTLTATGGIPPYFWGTGFLPLELSLGYETGKILGTPTEAFDSPVYINFSDSAFPPQYAYLNLPLKIIARLGITTTRLPAATPNIPYRVNLGLFGGTAPYAWSITSGALPNGLTLNAATGQITGTPTMEGTSSFTVRVTDTGPPVQTTSKALSLTIKNDLGRNDSPTTATPISNGTFRASLSPYADPVSGPAEPDNDYYALTANPGAVVIVETNAKRLVPESPVDTVIEIVDGDGKRFDTCRLGNDSYSSFNQPCLIDDIDLGVVQDSRLQFQVPGTGITALTFYVHVLDWSGNARPDFVYDLIVFGAN